jgi:hypothetical protein
VAGAGVDCALVLHHDCLCGGMVAMGVAVPVEVLESARLVLRLAGMVAMGSADPEEPSWSVSWRRSRGVWVIVDIFELSRDALDFCFCFFLVDVSLVESCH